MRNSAIMKLGQHDDVNNGSDNNSKAKQPTLCENYHHRHAGASSSAKDVEVLHRQKVARTVHAIWTDRGGDISGLALPLLDGRIDILGEYATLLEYVVPNQEQQSGVVVDTVEAVDLPYPEFFRRYMEPNIPVLIRGLTKDWNAMHRWVVKNNGKPNLPYLKRRFGHEIAPVHVQSEGGFTGTTMARPKHSDTTVADYADWWRRHQDELLLRDDNDNDNDTDTNTAPRELHYLKDWKFVARHPDDDLYDCPPLFRDDWLNDTTDAAYKFVYLGPRGTSTRLHTDVLHSYSWSANVTGVKRWCLVPPADAHLLGDCFGRPTVVPSHLHHDSAAPWWHPGLPHVRPLDLTQRAGETLFVPSGWYHTVENLEDTLSINHNWINGRNVLGSWRKLRREMEALREHHHDDGVPAASITPPSVTASDTHTTTIDKNNSSTGQVGDDLLLLYMMVSNKAQDILNFDQDDDDHATTAHDTMIHTDETGGILSLSGNNDSSRLETAMMVPDDNYNLTAILPVLEGIDEAITRSCGLDTDFYGLRDRCDYNGKELIRRVREHLSR